MNLIINGAKREVEIDTTLLALLAQLGASEPYAVAVNQSFVPREQCEGITLADGDQIEILSPIQGG
ncbi:sulfur carrier protein ThiS [Pseudoalteromonas spongiae]|uniref:Sulfur carrier protein ThiS n=1 Tax=Pseudoalteromonas spongiae TaxID=298657 RepID=A0ABU8ENP0_9GAMM